MKGKVKLFFAIVSVLVAASVIATAAPIRGLVDIATGIEIPDADLRYAPLGGAGLTTNDSPVMGPGTVWSFSLANVTNIADADGEIVNWQSMTNYIMGAVTSLPNVVYNNQNNTYPGINTNWFDDIRGTNATLAGTVTAEQITSTDDIVALGTITTGEGFFPSGLTTRGIYNRDGVISRSGNGKDFEVGNESVGFPLILYSRDASLDIGLNAIGTMTTTVVNVQSRDGLSISNALYVGGMTTIATTGETTNLYLVSEATNVPAMRVVVPSSGMVANQNHLLIEMADGTDILTLDEDGDLDVRGSGRFGSAGIAGAFVFGSESTGVNVYNNHANANADLNLYSVGGGVDIGIRSDGTVTSDFMRVWNDTGASVPAFMVTNGNTFVEGTLSVGSAISAPVIDFSVTGPLGYKEGRIEYDSTKGNHVAYNDRPNTALDIGYEGRIHGKNNTGTTITNGFIVYVSGTDSGISEISLADKDTWDESRTIGVATENITNGVTGDVTRWGDVNDIDTSHLVVGEIVYLGDDGMTTATRPTGGSFVIVIGICEIVNATTGKINVFIDRSDLAAEVTDTNGFPSEQRTNTVMSFTNANMTFAIAPLSSMFHYYDEGIKYEKTAIDNIAITDVEGLHVIYYDGDTLTTVANPTSAEVDVVIRKESICAYIYWNTNDSEQIYFADERHGIIMSPDTHSYLHFTQGAKWLQGGSLDVLDTLGSGGDDEDAKFSISGGFFADEDIITSPANVGTNEGLWVYYLEGASAEMRRDTNAVFWAKVLNATNLNGRLFFNEFTGGAWQLSEAGQGNFLHYHVFWVNGLNGTSPQNIMIMGQAEYGSAAAARTGLADEISDILTMFPQEETVPVATVLYQTRTTYGNAVMARTRVNADGEDYTSWITTEIGQGSPPGAHANLTGLDNDDHTQYFPITAIRAITGETTISNNLIVSSNLIVGTVAPSNSAAFTVRGNQYIAGNDLHSTLPLLDVQGVTNVPNTGWLQRWGDSADNTEVLFFGDGGATFDGALQAYSGKVVLTVASNDGKLQVKDSGNNADITLLADGHSSIADTFSVGTDTASNSAALTIGGTSYTDDATFQGTNDAHVTAMANAMTEYVLDNRKYFVFNGVTNYMEF